MFKVQVKFMSCMWAHLGIHQIHTKSMQIKMETMVHRMRSSSVRLRIPQVVGGANSR